VLVIDVDRFKAVNESLGHLVGDHVLGVLATRIKAFAGPGVLVSHFAADQYLVALVASSVDAALALAEHIRAAIAAPIEQDGYRLVLSVTIGLSHAPAHGRTPLELTRAAQAAAERGKAQGRDLVSVFDTEQLREIDDRVTLGSRLRLAVQRNELSLHFQPQFRARERRLTGFEALLRWSSPELGMVSPARFIPLAEALGLMPEIGAWVVRDACRQARAWLDEGWTGFCIAVNVSAQQLQRTGLVETVAAAIAEFRLPPHMLDIELTESSLMENVARVQGTLAELKQLGVTLSLDDFGTGYSSLAYLKNFSLDKLKIDQSFVRGLPGNPDDAAIARMIVAIGHQLRLVVSAEGVETADQADFLRDIDCDELQGYFLGRPVVADAAEGHFSNDAG
jgi:diguanylate cyclase (GGDEF)-like protein